MDLTGVSISQISLALVSKWIAIVPEGTVLTEGNWGSLSASLPHVNRAEVRVGGNYQAVTEDLVLGSRTGLCRGASHGVRRARTLNDER